MLCSSQERLKPLCFQNVHFGMKDPLTNRLVAFLTRPGKRKKSEKTNPSTGRCLQTLCRLFGHIDTEKQYPRQEIPAGTGHGKSKRFEPFGVVYGDPSPEEKESTPPPDPDGKILLPGGSESPAPEVFEKTVPERPVFLSACFWHSSPPTANLLKGTPRRFQGFL